MKILFTALAAAGLAGVATLPALAQDAVDPTTLTCADFMAMDSDAQMTAVEQLHQASMEGGMAGSSDTSASGDTSGDDSSADTSSSSDTSSDASSDTSSDSAADTAATSSAEDAMTSDDMVATLTTNCEGNDDMLAMDAMMSGGSDMDSDMDSDSGSDTESSE